jgi:hypothetical protein
VIFNLDAKVCTSPKGKRLRVPGNSILRKTFVCNKDEADKERSIISEVKISIIMRWAEYVYMRNSYISVDKPQQQRQSERCSEGSDRVT